MSHLGEIMVLRHPMTSPRSPAPVDRGRLCLFGIARGIDERPVFSLGIRHDYDGDAGALGAGAAAYA